MKVVKRINNNAVMCIDSKGRSVVAFGKGIAFAIDKETGDLKLSAIERTFYNVDEHYLALLEELNPPVLALSADIIEAADFELPYELSPNAVLALADHITFAIQRAKKGIDIRMPLAYDVAQMYPAEYRLGEYAVEQISRKLMVDLPKSEAVGIAMALLNASSRPRMKMTPLRRRRRTTRSSIESPGLSRMNMVSRLTARASSLRGSPRIFIISSAAFARVSP